MTADFRALCVELITSWDADGCDWKPHHQARWEATVTRARAALADQQRKSPTKHELFKLLLQSGGATQCVSIEWIEPFANAVLAHWGRQPAPPADGEVAELAAWLRSTGEGQPCLSDEGYARLTRAAELLERQVPLPVAVSERLPEPSDCAPWPDEPAASAWCWVGSDVDGGWSWEQRSAGCLAAFPDDFTHWLPAHALPLPEVNNG